MSWLSANWRVRTQPRVVSLA